MKKTAIAPSNIAFIKYWGKREDKLRLPTNDSFSMCIDKAYTTTTVEFSPKYLKDDISYLDGQMPTVEVEKIIRHLDRIRDFANSKAYAKVVTNNTFPKDSGAASSASGFAALTVAGFSAIGLNLSQKKLSIFARIGSGSAARSIPDGFVYWKKGKDSESSYAYSLQKEDYWDIRDVLVIVNNHTKKVKTTMAMDKATTSSLWDSRIKKMPNKIRTILKAFKEKNFTSFGEILEEEAVNMHGIIMTQKPPVFYWNKITMDIINNCLVWRESGIKVYFTIDAGANVHLICEEKNIDNLLKKIKDVNGIENVIVNKPAKGTRLVNNHLF